MDYKSKFTEKMYEFLNTFNKYSSSHGPEELEVYIKEAVIEIDRLKAIEQFYIKKLWDSRMPAYEEQSKKLMAMEDRAWKAEAEAAKYKKIITQLKENYQ